VDSFSIKIIFVEDKFYFIPNSYYYFTPFCIDFFLKVLKRIKAVEFLFSSSFSF